MRVKRIKFSLIILLCSISIIFLISLPADLSVKDYYRIVVLGDPHLPVKSYNIKSQWEKIRIISAKQKVVKDINSWKDVDRVIAVGDIVGTIGTEEEYKYAVEFLKKLKVPYSVIAGNHDYYFSDQKNRKRFIEFGTFQSREEKLKRFKKYFNLSNIYYSEHILNYLLIFLSVNSLTSTYMTEMSNEELSWLSIKLKENKNIPIIIFYHAPLKGTLLDRYLAPARGDLVAQPEMEIDGMLKENLQVFLWVSGHTHTLPTDESFNAAYNLYLGKVLNIHNTDMDRITIWTNSIYIYKDKVVIKTYNHKEKKWLKEMERTVIPLLLN